MSIDNSSMNTPAYDAGIPVNYERRDTALFVGGVVEGAGDLAIDIVSNPVETLLALGAGFLISKVPIVGTAIGAGVAIDSALDMDRDLAEANIAYHNNDFAGYEEEQKSAGKEAFHAFLGATAAYGGASAARASGGFGGRTLNPKTWFGRGGGGSTATTTSSGNSGATPSLRARLSKGFRSVGRTITKRTREGIELYGKLDPINEANQALFLGNQVD